MPLRVDSEIGRLRRVLVHRPGREIDWMVPAMMETLLFDDILDGDDARLEHDGFRQVLRQAGVEVLDSQDLLADVVSRVIVSPDVLRGCGEAARRTVEERFSIRRMTRQLEEAYVDVAERCRAG